MVRDLIQTYPELAAVLVLVLGVVVAKVAELAVRRALDVVERLANRYGAREQALVSPVFKQGFALVVFATVLVLAIVIAVRLLDIAHLTAWLESVLSYVPRFVLGLFIIGIGNVLGALLRTITAGIIAKGDIHAFVPRLVHVSVVTIAVITGLQQVGINISFIVQLSLIALAALLGGLSLAFALGARQYVANLLAQSELARYTAGDRLRIDDDEGVVVDIHRTGITLATDQGQVAVPASRLASGPVLRIAEAADGD
jgi:small-conductance mechanosensitive channel